MKFNSVKEYEAWKKAKETKKTPATKTKTVAKK